MKIRTDTDEDRGQRQTLRRGQARDRRWKTCKDSPTATLMILNSGRPVGLTDSVSILFCLSGTRDDRQDEGRANQRYSQSAEITTKARTNHRSDTKDCSTEGNARQRRRTEGTELQQRKTPSLRMEQTLSLKILLTRTNTDEENAKDSRTVRRFTEDTVLL